MEKPGCEGVLLTKKRVSRSNVILFNGDELEDVLSCVEVP